MPYCMLVQTNSFVLKIYLRGRELGKFEVLDHPWVFDSSEGKLYWHDFSPDEMRAKANAEKE